MATKTLAIVIALVLSWSVLARAADKATCTTVTRASESGFGHVTLELAEVEWGGWDALCGDLTRYMSLGAPPFRAEQTTMAQNLLLETGYFRGAKCELRDDATHLHCQLRPREIVHDVKITGHVPFALLGADVRRRLFLRPGILLGPVQRDLEQQEKRLADYLVSEGYFGSDARITLSPVEGAEPNQGVLVEAQIWAGETAKLRAVDLVGDAVLSQDEIKKILTHHWLLYVAESRFRPLAFDEDIEKVATAVRRRGHPEARVRGEYHHSPQDSAVDAVVFVDAGPFLVERFGGNAAFSAEELAKLTTFADAGVIDLVEVDNSKAALVEAYQRKGYYAVKIEADLSGDRDKELVVTFSITEGPRTELSEIVVRGNHKLSEKRIEKAAQLASQKSSFWSTGRWVDSYVAHDVSAITELYHAQGFAEAKVEAKREEAGEGKLRLVFEITEGPSLTVGTCDVVGLPPELSARKIERELSLRDGAPFVPDGRVADERSILTRLAALGYAQAEVTSDYEPKDVREGRVNVTYSVVPNDRSRFGGVLVRGNFRTHEGLIEQEIGLEPDAPLNVEALGQARSRLRELGIFASADLKPLATYRDGGPTWFLAALEERDQRSVDAVVSFATDELFSVGADYQDRNLLGRALRLNAELRWSNASEVLTRLRIGNLDRFRVLMSAPRPFGFPLNAEANALYQFEDQALFSERRVGASASMWRMLVTQLQCKRCPNLITSFSYELVSTQYNPKGPEAPAADSLAPDGTMRNGTIGRVFPKVSVDDRDSYVDPQRGYYTEARFEYANRFLAANLNNASNFLRLIVAGQLYLPIIRARGMKAREGTTLGGPLVLALGATAGAAKPLVSNDKNGIPLSETFYYGGDTSVRGLRDRASQSITQGALYMVTASVELRWYFLRDIGIGSLQAAAFTDTGTVSYTASDLYKETTVTMGPALRYVTPVGPVSLAYGFPVLLPPGLDDDGRLHFSFGYTF